MLVNLDTNNHTKMARQNSTTPIVEICCNLNRVDSSNQDSMYMKKQIFKLFADLA